ncbi:MAG: helix-turn-helix domain-containing protein [Akkermansiaceae bacterium]
MDSSPTPQDNLIERLKASPFYQICQDSFRKATGLPLVIIGADNAQFNPGHASPNQNHFCRLLNSKHGTCEECKREQQHILSQSREQSYTHTCFAGLKETSVPLRLGKETIGFLKTGQIFTQKPDDAHTGDLRKLMESNGYTKTEQNETLKAYRNTPVFDQDQYRSMITLLNVVSLQLAELLNRLMLENHPQEPEIVRRAKDFITDRIDEKLSLAQIADEVNVSTYYFCKLFKQSTGMTFTEFTNRQRIELAKQELAHSEKPVTEIAYAVGFQSLSQFNRSFCKFTGESPREYRHHTRSTGEVGLLRLK